MKSVKRKTTPIVIGSLFMMLVVSAVVLKIYDTRDSGHVSAESVVPNASTAVAQETPAPTEAIVPTTSTRQEEEKESRALQLHAAQAAKLCPSSNSPYLLLARVKGDRLFVAMAPLNGSQGIDSTQMTKGVLTQEDGDGFWVEHGENGNKVTLWFIEVEGEKTQWFLSINDSQGNLKLGYNGECTP